MVPCFSRDKTPGSHGLFFLISTAMVVVAAAAVVVAAVVVVAAAAAAAGGGETPIMTVAMTVTTDMTSMTIGIGE